MISLNLPRPPSVNELYHNVSAKQKAIALSKGIKLRGRARTEKYNAWRNEAGWMLLQQRQKPIKGRVSILCEVEDKGRVDVGNLEKAITDLLVLHKMIEGDGREVVRRIAMEWANVEGVRVTVQGIGEG